jgi:calcineurin-like phosphoesterase family protein
MVQILKHEKYGYIKLSGEDTHIWFTSDHHFYHENIIRLAKRPFNNVEKMTQILIDYWNNTVEPDDIVFHLGDFCWSRDPSVWKKLLDRLNGKKVLILGNHDSRKCVEQVQNEYHRFIDIRERLEVRWSLKGTNNDIKRYILDHYPQYEWEGSYHGVYHLHGHIHEKDSAIAKIKSYNVSVERNCYRPVSLNEINYLFEYKEANNLLNLGLNNLILQ